MIIKIMKKIVEKVLTIKTISIILIKQSTSTALWMPARLQNPGILAQLGEHLPYKQRVIGSSPIGPTDSKESIQFHMAE